jgi:hypothetical protein
MLCSWYYEGESERFRGLWENYSGLSSFPPGGVSDDTKNKEEQKAISPSRNMSIISSELNGMKKGYYSKVFNG